MPAIHARTRLSKKFPKSRERRSLRVHQSHPSAQKRLRAALCGASAPGLRRRDGACRDGALHQSLGVDPVITPAYHRVRNTGVIRSDRNPSRSSGSRTVLGFSVTVFRLAGSFQPGPHTRLAGSGRLSCAARSRAISSKLRPSPSSLASKPVKACHRFTATSTYAGPDR